MVKNPWEDVIPEFWRDYNSKGKKVRAPVPPETKTKLWFRSNSKCEKCKTPLNGFFPEVHHKDKDPSNPNPKPTHLLLLCPTCHAKIHYKDMQIRRKQGRKRKKGGFKPLAGIVPTGKSFRPLAGIGKMKKPKLGIRGL